MQSPPLLNHVRFLAGASLRRKLRRQRESFLHTARTGCRTAQREVLNEVLRLNADSAFAQEHDLKAGLSVEEYRQRIPVADYDLIRPAIEKMKAGDHQALLGPRNRLLMYAVTSATTADSKLIPVTTEFVRRYRKSWQMWAIGAYTRHDALQRLNIMQLTSSHRRFATTDGTPCGNISGLVASMQNRIVRSMYTIPYEVTGISDPAVKRYVTLRIALADPFVGMMITANPGTLTQLFEFLNEHAQPLIRDLRDGGVHGVDVPSSAIAPLRRCLRRQPARAAELERILDRCGSLPAAECWPQVRLLGVWSGGSVGSYLPMLQQHFPDAAVRDHGLHASEGRMTLPLDDSTPAGVLEVETHFFEFIPVAEADSSCPVVLEAHELEEGGEYFILLTTCSGLHRYNISDVVRCVGFYGETPLLEFRHKGAHISSITGEKIAESQVVEAVRTAAAETGVGLRTFTLTPDWGEPPGYLLYLELQQAGSDSNDAVERLADCADRHLQSRNVEYAEKRQSHRLSPIRGVLLDGAAWGRFRHSRTSTGGGSEEQYKHPCLLPDPQFEKIFLKTCGEVNASVSGAPPASL